MAKMCYAQLHGVDGETVEATISSYHNREELPSGQWTVCIGSSSPIIMAQADMPEHWQREIARWSVWGETL